MLMELKQTTMHYLLLNLRFVVMANAILGSLAMLFAANERLQTSSKH